ncbi:MAG: hypothetical protein IT258_15015 [Saprospiraceae bacterium]|nr:hypothetical protein [Saprospiraceae bacterium]
MNTPLTQYLLQTNYHQLSQMLYQHPTKPEYEIFFDTSNQIELYKNEERIGTWHIATVEALKEVLAQQNLLE